jgi:hypothetical protein
MEMDCSECELLRKQYDSLWQDYSTAMNALMALRQTARRMQYLQLGEDCHNARDRCEEARLLLLCHEAAHSRSKAGGPGPEHLAGVPGILR